MPLEPRWVHFNWLCGAPSIVQTQATNETTCPKCLLLLLKAAEARGEKPGPGDAFKERIEPYRKMSYWQLVVARKSMIAQVKDSKNGLSWRYRYRLFKFFERTEHLMRNAGRALVRQHEDEQIQKMRESAPLAKQDVPVRKAKKSELSQQDRSLPLTPVVTAVTQMLQAEIAVRGTSSRRNLRHWQETEKEWKGKEVGHRHIKRKKPRPHRYD